MSAWCEALRWAHHTTWHPCPGEWKAPIQGACHCRGEQIPASLQPLPVERLALPSITQGQTGHRSLPDLTGCPGFLHFNSPLNSDLAQPAGPLTCLREAQKRPPAFFPFSSRKKQTSEQWRTGLASPAESLALCSGPRKDMHTAWILLFSVAYLTINYRSNISNSDSNSRDLQRSQTSLCIPAEEGTGAPL